MTLNSLFAVFITSALPISELRGGIPLGIGLGLDPFIVFLTSYIANILIFFPLYFGLEILYNNFFIKIKPIKKIVEKSHKKVNPYIEKYGFFGLTFFIAVPLPITGAYTGTTAAWVLGLEWKKTFLAVCLGVFIAALIVSAVSLGVLGLVNFI